MRVRDGPLAVTARGLDAFDVLCAHVSYVSEAADQDPPLVRRVDEQGSAVPVEKSPRR
jgi:hypothetical protein